MIRYAASLALSLIAALAHAQPAAGRTGTVIVAHGGDSAWNARVLEVAASVQTGGPVEVSFLMGPEAPRRRFQDAVKNLEAQGVASIVVVPMLVSSYSGHYEQIRWLAGEDVALDSMMRHHLHMAGIDRSDTRLPMRVTSAMDGAPQVARVVADRALALAPASRERALFIVGHGPNSAEDHARWMKNLRLIADSVRAWTGFRDVRVDVVRDDAPATVRAEAVLRVRELIAMQHELTQQDVVVVPILVSKGAVSRDRIPADLAGLPMLYTGEPLLPHPGIARWVESRVREKIATAP
jgi:sirohydrochlorin ferrochelatase